jgi:hypothetical protein
MPIAKRRIHKQAGRLECWRVHPQDKVAMIYQQEADDFGKPEVFRLTGETRVGILTEIVVQWT